MEWASIKTIRREIAEMPEAWFDEFILDPDHYGDIRKGSGGRNCKMNLRVSAVLAAIEAKYGGLRDGYDIKAAADAACKEFDEMTMENGNE